MVCGVVTRESRTFLHEEEVSRSGSWAAGRVKGPGISLRSFLPRCGYDQTKDGGSGHLWGVGMCPHLMAGF